MRITIINQFYVPDISPTAQLASSLAVHRARRGDHVTVIASTAAYDQQDCDGDLADVSNVRVIRLWVPQPARRTLVGRLLAYGIFYVQALLWMALLPRQQVIVALTTPPLIGLVPVLHKLIYRKVRLILWNMDCYPEVAERTGLIKADGVTAKLIRAINHFVFQRLDHVVSLDNAMRQLLDSQYARHGHSYQSTVIANWEPMAAYSPAAWGEAVGDVQDRDQSFVVLYSGNMGHGHEFDTIMDVAERMREDRIEFVFNGGGQQWPVVRAIARSRQLHNVRLHGYAPRDRFRAALAAADCALITLRKDMLGVMSPSKLHACLGTGLPVLYIGPEGSNVDEAIQEFHCGASHRPRDVDGVVTFLRRVMRNEFHRRTYKRNARTAFDSRYTDRHALPLFDEIIEATPAAQRPKTSATWRRTAA